MTTSKPSVQIYTSQKGILMKMQAIQKTRYLALLCSCKSPCSHSSFMYVYTWQVLTIGEFRIGMIHGHQVSQCQQSCAYTAINDRQQQACCDMSVGTSNSVLWKASNSYVMLLTVVHALTGDVVELSGHVYTAAGCTFRKQRALGISCQTDGCGHSCNWAHT